MILNFQTQTNPLGHEYFYAEKIANTFAKFVYGPFNDPNNKPTY